MPGEGFGALTPLLAPRSVAVVGASDREGNLGGDAVRFLRKFGFHGPIWPVNAGRSEVAGLPCFPSLAALPSVPDLAILAVPAATVVDLVKECIGIRIPAALAWAGGFAEGGDEGRARQRELEAACRGSSLKFCGPNCIGIINTSIGLTATFTSMLSELDGLRRGTVSMVSQSGGIAVSSHSRAEEFGLGFRVTISCGNEAVLGVPDFIQALVQDEETRVIAVYIEGLSNPTALIEALAAARRQQKPVVILKGGASEASFRAALAHTGRLAGVDRTYDAIFREFAAIRVFSIEEMIDVCLQFASLRPGQLPRSDRVLLSSFGGGSGVIGTDQCAREGLAVPTLDPATHERVAPLLTPLGSSVNPVDLTPGSMTNPKLRAKLPELLRALSEAPNIDTYIFLSAGFGELAPELVAIFEQLRRHTPKPVCISWLSPPKGVIEALAARGVYTFTEHARAIRAAGHLVRYAADLRHRIRRSARRPSPFAWDAHVDPTAAHKVVSENVVARILEAAGLPVAPGRLAVTADEAVHAAEEVGLPVVIKAISPALTHRAAAGFVALNVETADAVARTDRRFRARAAERGIALEGNWVQHMVKGDQELLITAFRDQEFGVMVGCGVGGGLTEIIDDVVFARAPIDQDGAYDLLGRLRTVRKLPRFLSESQRERAASFVARFSELVATAPWQNFTLEVNPLKLGSEDVAAVDGLLVLE